MRAYRSDEPAEVEKIRLYYVHGTMLDHPAEPPQAAVLLASGNWQLEFVGDLLRLVVVVERQGLFEECEAMFVHDPPNPEGHRNVVRTVRIRVDGHPLAEGLPGQRNESQIPACRVIVIAHACPEPELDCACAGFVDEFLQIRDLGFGRVPSVSAGAVDRNVAADERAEELAERLSQPLVGLLLALPRVGWFSTLNASHGNFPGAATSSGPGGRSQSDYHDRVHRFGSS